MKNPREIINQIDEELLGCLERRLEQVDILARQKKNEKQKYFQPHIEFLKRRKLVNLLPEDKNVISKLQLQNFLINQSRALQFNLQISVSDKSKDLCHWFYGASSPAGPSPCFSDIFEALPAYKYIYSEPRYRFLSIDDLPSYISQTGLTVYATWEIDPKHQVPCLVLTHSLSNSFSNVSLEEFLTTSSRKDQALSLVELSQMELEELCVYVFGFSKHIENALEPCLLAEPDQDKKLVSFIPVY